MTRLVQATAPVRVCDAGGWTDTWFAQTGLVCSVAVEPGAHVTVRTARAGEPRVELCVGATGERYGFDPGEPPQTSPSGDAARTAERKAAAIRRHARPSGHPNAPPGRHPLLEASVATLPPPAGTSWQIEVSAGVPPGCGTGTSAAVVVALLGALAAARGDEPSDPADLAARAHAIETGLGWQSGVQDQHAAAHGGVNLITMTDYPTAAVRPVVLDDEIRAELDRRLVTVYLGSPHWSSALHEQVIAHLEADRAAGGVSSRLEPLRRAAAAAADALAAGDLEAYGAALRDNTEAQAALHPDLVSHRARRLIDLAREHGAAGWKVNGAGGDGGTVSIVGPEPPPGLVALVDAVDAGASHHGWRRLPLRLAPRGVTVT